MSKSGQTDRQTDGRIDRRHCGTYVEHSASGLDKKWGVHRIARTKYGDQKIKTLKLIGRVAKCEVEFFLSPCDNK